MHIYIYIYTVIYPRVLPREYRIRRGKGGARRYPATYTTTQYILIHTSHTYTSTSQSRDHVIMSELGITILHGAHVHRRSTIDSAPIILADLLLVKRVSTIWPLSRILLDPSPPCAPSPFSLFRFSLSFVLYFHTITIACLYTLHIY